MLAFLKFLHILSIFFLFSQLSTTFALVGTKSISYFITIVINNDSNNNNDNNNKCF